VPTRFSEVTPAQRGLAVAAVLAVVLIIVALSSGGGGGSASGFHDPKLLTASIAYQGAAVSAPFSPKFGGSPYGARCHETAGMMNCTYQGAPASCPLDIGNSTVCQFTNLDASPQSGQGAVNLRVTITPDGRNYTATAGYVPISDHIGG